MSVLGMDMILVFRTADAVGSGDGTVREAGVSRLVSNDHFVDRFRRVAPPRKF